jgi:hypothetical protein
MTVQDRDLRPDESRHPESGNGKAMKSVHDVLRMVRDSLGDEGVRRLEEDGVGNGLLGRRKSGGIVV